MARLPLLFLVPLALGPFFVCGKVPFLLHFQLVGQLAVLNSCTLMRWGRLW